MDFRNGDNSSRNIINSTLIQNEYGGTDSWSSLGDFLSTEPSRRQLDLSKFEIINKMGYDSIILNRFFLSLEDPRYLTKIKFDHFQANELSEKIKSIAKHVYGDTCFYYLIMYFNNITHPSELSVNYLMNNGLVVLNGTGLNKLNEVVQFISSKSASAEEGEGVLGL